MITLRLFHSNNPFRQIEERTLQDGELVVGRDHAAQWPIADPDCEVSRQHCVIKLKDGRIIVRDTSSNGVYLGPDRRRTPREQPVEVAANETIHIGQFMIVMEPAAANDAGPGEALDAPFHKPILQDVAVSANSFAVPSQWKNETSAPEAMSAARPLSDAALLDAFCAGAKLDASSFAGEDPAEVLRRAGAVYQQVIVGLGDLMSERTSLKSAFAMDRTTVAAADNNPFKWAPAERLAIDMLRTRHDGFLTGPAALKASFEDLKKHVICLMAGSRAAVSATLDALNPDAVSEQAGSSLFMTKSEACWRQVQTLHASLASEARENADSAINRAFRQGYEQQLRQIEEMDTRS